VAVLSTDQSMRMVARDGHGAIGLELAGGGGVEGG
jgi:hypothetical protein